MRLGLIVSKKPGAGPSGADKARQGQRALAARALLLLLALAAGPAARAEEELSPAEATLEEGSGSSLGPFAYAGTVLQARKLRGLTSEVAGLVLRGVPGGNFAMNVLALPLPGEGEKALVPLFVEIDGASFLDSNRTETTRVEVYAYALGAEGGVAGYLAEVFVINVSGLGEAVWQSGLKFYGHLDLPPGDYTLRVLLRNYQSEAAALRELPLNVPAAGAARPLPPLFPGPSARDAWMPIREWDPEGPMAAGRYPFVAGGEAVSPATRPVLVAGRVAPALAFDPGRGRAPEKVEFLAEGQKVGEAPVEAAPAGAPMAAASGRPLSFRVPEELPAGHYSLRAVNSGGPEGDLRSLPLEVFVLQQGIREPDLLWTDLRWLLSENADQDAALAAAASLELEAASERQKKKIRKKIIEKIVGEYRAALGLLDSGEESARAALLDLESRVLADSTRATVAALGAAEWQTIESLASSELESLIPVMMLHESLYRTYRQRRLFSLLSHTRSMVERIAVLYAEQGGTEGSRIVAARSLASLGGYVQGANLPASSRRLFLLALEHDPANKAALLGLAASFEKYGDYPRAAEYLEALVLAHPEYGEGLLRHAINLRRTGDRLRARETLAAVMEQKAGNWVDTLACEEIARGALADGRLEEAATLLEGALRRAPDRGSLRLLLAHVYDRLGKPYQAFDVIDGLRPARGEGLSPRKIYDSWPEHVFVGERRQLEEAAKVRIPTLRSLLDRSGGAAR